MSRLCALSNRYLPILDPYSQSHRIGSVSRLILGNTISETIVSDVLGEPESWANCISDELVGLPDLREATILDVFVSRNGLALYTLAATGAEAMAVFVIENQGLRKKIATVMQPGLNVSTALQAAV